MRFSYLVVLFLVFSCGNQKIERLKIIATDLLEIEDVPNFRSNKNSEIKDLVNIGNNLYEVLKNRKISVDSISIEVRKGDFFEEGNKVTHSILYNTSKSKLGLRMRYDKEIDKFHIVGYSGTIE